MTVQVEFRESNLKPILRPAGMPRARVGNLHQGNGKEPPKLSRTFLPYPGSIADTVSFTSTLLEKGEDAAFFTRVLKVANIPINAPT